jgi:hypothetical protein
MDKLAVPFFVVKSPYEVHSSVKRVSNPGGLRGEQVSILGLDPPDAITGPFLFFAWFVTNAGIVRVEGMDADRDKVAFASALSRYGDVDQGHVRYVGQAQIDRIFSDLATRVLVGLPRAVSTFLAFQQVVDSMSVVH